MAIVGPRHDRGTGRVPQDSGNFWFRVAIAVVAVAAVAMLIFLIDAWQAPPASSDTAGEAVTMTAGTAPAPMSRDVKPQPSPQDGYGVQPAMVQPAAAPAPAAMPAPAPGKATSATKAAAAVVTPRAPTLVCVLEYRSGAALHRRVTARLPGASRCYRLRA